MQTWQNLAEILEAATLTNDLDFTCTYTDADEEVHTFTIFDTDFFVHFTNQIQYNRRIRADVENPINTVLSDFAEWSQARADYYARRAYALSIKYNPLDNYDSTETRTGSLETTHGETLTRTHADTQTQTLNNSDTRTHADTDTQTLANTDTDTRSFTNRQHVNQRNVDGFNSLTAAPAETITDSDTGTETDAIAHTGTVTDAHTGTITDAHSGTVTDAHTGTITDAHSGKDTTTDGYTLKRHGNIGVTTSSQMLFSDYDLLKRDLGITALYEFYDCFTMVCDSIDL